MTDFVSPFTTVQMHKEISDALSKTDYADFRGTLKCCDDFRHLINDIRITSCRAFGLDPAQYEAFYWGSREHMYQSIFMHFGDAWTTANNNLMPYFTLFSPSTVALRVAEQFTKTKRIKINVANVITEANKVAHANTLLCCVTYDTNWGLCCGEARVKTLIEEYRLRNVPVHVDIDYALSEQLPQLADAGIITWTLDHCWGPAGGHVFGLVSKHVWEVFGCGAMIGVDPHAGLHHVWRAILERPIPVLDTVRETLLDGLRNIGTVHVLNDFEQQYRHRLHLESKFIFVLLTDPQNAVSMRSGLAFFMIWHRNIVLGKDLVEYLRARDIFVNCTAVKLVGLSELSTDAIKSTVVVGIHQYVQLAGVAVLLDGIRDFVKTKK